MMDYETKKKVERAVMEDHYRPCLYGVAPPCQHPNCLEAHYNTLLAEELKLQGAGNG